MDKKRRPWFHYWFPALVVLGIAVLAVMNHSLRQPEKPEQSKPRTMHYVPEVDGGTVIVER